MNAAIAEDIYVPAVDIVSPSGRELQVVFQPGMEGLSVNTGMDIFEGMLTYQELNDHFDVEANSNELNPVYKLQRDVDKPRVKNITGYLQTREDTCFPSISIFVTKVDTFDALVYGGRTLVQLCIAPETGRLICDGQGRTFSIRSLLDSMPHITNYTIGVKLIVTNTPTLRHAKKAIKQVFSDFNGNVKKPNSSISMYYDSAKPFSRLLQELVALPVAALDGAPLHCLIAVDGVCRNEQLWTHKQFSDFMKTYLNATEAELNKVLADNEQYSLTKDFAITFIEKVMRLLPVSQLAADNGEYAKNAMFTKALFATGLAYCGRSIVEDAAHMEEAVDWSRLDGLTELPLDTLDDDFWLKPGITFKDDVLVGRTGKTKSVVKIMKGCSKKIGRALTNKLRIMPCADI